MWCWHRWIAQFITPLLTCLVQAGHHFLEVSLVRCSRFVSQNLPACIDHQLFTRWCDMFHHNKFKCRWRTETSSNIRSMAYARGMERVFELEAFLIKRYELPLLLRTRIRTPSFIALRTTEAPCLHVLPFLWGDDNHLLAVKQYGNTFFCLFEQNFCSVMLW